jgi:DNA polymerase
MNIKMEPPRLSPFDLHKELVHLIHGVQRQLLCLKTEWMGQPSSSANPPSKANLRSDLDRRVSPKRDVLSELANQVKVCQACRLSQSRTQTVFGEGPCDALVVFVGEGPGKEEDLQGRPFVGAAGMLLTQMLQAMKLDRQAVYITNVVKCRPPNNRVPQPDEIEACHPFLKKQLLAIRPKVICALGRTAAYALLKTDLPMQSLRGRSFVWEGIPVVVTFHPAYLLRNPSAKPMALHDLKRVLAILHDE